jgi:hypothetical protein
LKNFKESLLITFFTFVLTIVVALLSYSWIESISFFPAVIILIVIIFIGVISDMVGIAAAAAKEKPFHAKASKKVFGAKKGLFLVRHANRVSNFMCDIVGDICGIISGSLGLVIIIKMANNWQLPRSWIDLFVLSLIASLTVGGKSFLKSYGIKKANEIILLVGKILASPTLLRDMLNRH